ncbi:phosphoribosylamine--glycine ligase [Sphingomonas melonis TY]|jgi:phosphoribosylamine---glycine ligase|uniref:Phosphoribosylamine--glycine ligase n=1 Tax=Sphingomonas melonis TY TaxID=621456 RepID=A0A175Y4Q7_9SPHN|nr:MULTISPECIES: phosphoribosylamine--glycine ligase [Sphingomonas]AOW22543.1 phosphoribosylamine--glycine ligase [Sphingomonas melonis TY]ATI55938.1 phosphoribosylamine--glycine ligase [Sphingomonas melonis]KZB95538.1 phosphoribosylamine--glycine ligase [Sphingomonas melonis TY]MBI0530553.1 phosphoribosylamine--glycine ligase [Sphingomonas sp. TX0522]MBX8844423.1 phosphoribosylamine--glycine ligase [Sphingomonas melonis]
MNVLLLGSGGREHALAWKLAQSPTLDTLYAAPGNPGIAQHATCVALDATDHAAVIDFVRAQAIGLVVIGPEAPLVDGLADSLRTAGVPVFGPDKAAAQLEGSKGFTKDLCRRADIPTAGYVRVTSRTEAEAALAATFGYPVVIKADGLAAGKGVVIATSEAEAAQAFDAMFAQGDAPVVLEEFLEGEEASLFVLTDGTALLPFGSAQDHKRVGEGDTGPNTGGMGAYSPAPVLTPDLEERAIAEIVAPTVKAMREEGMPFSGVLYAGLMLTRTGPKLIEYNARFGDPECQVLMMRFQGDLLAVMLATAEGRLAMLGDIALSDDIAMTVVLAAAGYPGTPKAGGAIRGIDAAEATGAIVFQAGTKQSGDTLAASGGRVLAVTATGPDIRAARDAAYRGVDAIDFADGFCRRDIGWRELAR